MDNDPITRIFFGFAIIVFAIFSLRPDWSIRLLSYGRNGIQDVNPSLVLTVRAVAGFAAIVGVIWFIVSCLKR